MTPPRRRLRTLLPLLSVALSVAAAAEAPKANPELGRRLVNDRCPVMVDEPASPTYEVPFNGVAVRFCCSDCQETFTEDPSAYVSRLPQLPLATLHATSFEHQQHARAERAADWLDRWTRPVSLLLAALISGLLARRILRRTRLAHANARIESAAGLHPATGPRLPD